MNRNLSVSTKVTIDSGISAARILIESVFNNNKSADMPISCAIPSGDTMRITNLKLLLGSEEIKTTMYSQQENDHLEWDDYVPASMLPQNTDILYALLGTVRPGGTIKTSVTYVLEIASPQTDNSVGYYEVPCSIKPWYYSSRRLLTSDKVTIKVNSLLPWEFSGDLIDSNLMINLNPFSETPIISFNIPRPKLELVTLLDSSRGYAYRMSLSSSINGCTLTRLNNKCIVFFVDCSASMSDTIQEAIRVLQYFVQSLPEGVLFNVVKFGSQFNKLFDIPMQLTQETFTEAKRYCQSMKANLGGTELFAPLHEVSSRFDPDHQNCCIVITDGGVSDTEPVLQLARKAYSTKACAIHCIGIGNRCCSDLVRGLAQSTTGQHCYVKTLSTAVSKITSLMTSFLGCNKAQLVSPNGEVTRIQIPQKSTVYHYGFCSEVIKETDVWKLAGSDVLFSVEESTDPSIPLVAASRFIKRCEDFHQNSIATEQMIIDAKKVSVAHQIKSKFTSVVASNCGLPISVINISNDDVLEEDSYSLRRRRRRRRLRSWSSSDESIYGYRRSVSRDRRLRNDSSDTDMNRCRERRFVRDNSRSRDRDYRRYRSGSRSRSPDRRSPDAILFLQESNGSWSPSLKLASLLNISKSNFQNSLIITTRAVLDFLESEFATCREDWKLIHDKGVSFLKEHSN